MRKKIILGLVASATLAGPLATSAQASDSSATVPVPANPLSAPVCNVLPVLPAAPTGVQWSAVTDHRALNGKVGVTATPAPGYAFPNGVTTKAYAAPACLFGVPTVVNGVPVYGASANGVWKVGSKVTLESGSEFQTHGGTDSSGPIARYRLVFTPNAGFTLPNTLPGDGFKVGSSAVYHVYVSVPYEVRFSDTSGKHINLPDVFDIEHTAYPEGTYWATKVRVNVINDTNTAREFRIRYNDVQDGDRVWVQGTRFTDGLPNNVVPANSSRPFEIEVWHNVVSGSDVPDDLTLDFGFELA
jgi:hypothetical protein